jgi:hypothetical protein
MFVRIENDIVVEKNTIQHEGMIPCTAEVWDALRAKVDGGVLRPFTEAENEEEEARNFLGVKWLLLRGDRDGLLKETDGLVIADRPPVSGVIEYRQMLRDLPSTFTDVTVLTAPPVPSFEEWLAAQA